MKRFFTYPIFVVLFLSCIAVMGFSAIVKYHYDGGEKYQFLQKPVMLIAAAPSTFKELFHLMTKFHYADVPMTDIITGDFIVPINDIVYENKKVFEKN